MKKQFLIEIDYGDEAGITELISSLVVNVTQSIDGVARIVRSSDHNMLSAEGILEICNNLQIPGIVMIKDYMNVTIFQIYQEKKLLLQ